MMRVFIFLLIAILLLSPLFLVAIPFSIWYMYRFVGYELVVLAVLVDGYFGAFYSMPYLSVITICLVFFIDLLKPHLLMYTNEDDVVS